MKLKLLMGVAVFGLLAACSPAEGTKPAETTAEPAKTEAAPVADAKAPNDYGNPDTWLCHPSKADNDACSIDLTTTIVSAGDTAPVTEEFYAAADPGFDCFYVYPTASTDPTPNSDMHADPAELNVVKAQFARFGEVCRLYAPIYRQMTLAGLRTLMMGQPSGADTELAFKDVQDAWNYYLEHENNGRGVVLVGHSQGSNMIQQLLKTDILGKPSEDLLISAMPVGITYPLDRETQKFNGTMELCKSKEQIGCLIAYSSFRVDSPPPPTSFFGVSRDPAQQAACVNPSDLTGHDTLHAYLSNIPNGTGVTPNWAGDDQKVTTPFVGVPGLLSGKCTENGNHTYLAITTHGDPNDPRTDRVDGDVYIGGVPSLDWGLHLGDVNYAIGDLIEIADAQSKVWKAKHAE